MALNLLFLEVNCAHQKVAGHHHPRAVDHRLPKAVSHSSLMKMDHHHLQTMMMNTHPIRRAAKKMVKLGTVI